MQILCEDLSPGYWQSVWTAVLVSTVQLIYRQHPNPAFNLSKACYPPSTTVCLFYGILQIFSFKIRSKKFVFFTTRHVPQVRNFSVFTNGYYFLQFALSNTFSLVACSMQETLRILQ